MDEAGSGIEVDVEAAVPPARARGHGRDGRDFVFNHVSVRANPSQKGVSGCQPSNLFALVMSSTFEGTSKLRGGKYFHATGRPTRDSIARINSFKLRPSPAPILKSRCSPE